MTEIYLWLNAFIYVFFALWCSVKRQHTSKASGYLDLNSSGWSEYLVIYGGLQLGLALFFAYLALNTALFKTGLIFSVCLYGPIVVYRLITLYKFRVVEKTTLAIGFMEILLLLGAVILIAP